MGKTRPPDRAKLSKRNKKLISQKKAAQSQTPTQLLLQATTLLQTSQPDAALHPATQALTLLQRKHNSEPVPELLPALSILGEIQLELGDADSARDCFLQAAAIDEDGSVAEELGGGVEKFLWLAQLSEEGGEDSVQWFEKGAILLRSQILGLSSASTNGATQDADQSSLLEEKKLKLASALCGIAEVYMTDLSFDDAEAESRCNAAMAEAIAIAPDSAETLQTLANVRISQQRIEEAQRHLAKSLSLWQDLDPEDEKVPPFPTRISLVRLLMDAEMEDEAIDVLERLIQEDDNSVEAWYLGGWCLNIIAGKKSTTAPGPGAEQETTLDLQKRSRQWLLHCLQLCQKLEYEDERLEEHAREIVVELNEVLGEPMEDEANEEDEEWEDQNDDDDDDDDGGDDGDEDMEET